jgi:hypothetical protein
MRWSVGKLALMACGEIQTCNSGGSLVRNVLTAMPSFTLAPVVAQSSNDRELCFKGGLPPDQWIDACTAVIQSGAARSQDLAGAFNNRGRAYVDERDYDRAIGRGRRPRPCSGGKKSGPISF